MNENRSDTDAGTIQLWAKTSKNAISIQNLI